MEALFFRSRSVIQNPIYEKFKQKRYESHIKQIQKIRLSDHQTYGKEDNINYLKNLQKGKSAHKLIEKLFDSNVLENKSLYKRLLQVQNKKGSLFICYQRPSNIIGAKQNSLKKSNENKLLISKNKQLRTKLQKHKVSRIVSIHKMRVQMQKHDNLVKHIKKIRV